MHDSNVDSENNKYFPSEIFSGYAAAKTKFIFASVKAGLKADVVILSHINLLLAAWLIKKANPKVQIILMAHGIEIWGILSPTKQMMLRCCDKIASVSSFTSNKIQEEQGMPKQKCLVLNNCIDPFLERPVAKLRDEALVKRYGIQKDDVVLLTLTRLSLRDRYKGYNYTIQALAALIPIHKNIKYILAGKYSESEKMYIDEMVAILKLRHNVVLTGYIAEEELANHFALADIYIMPSIKEGFGIVFVEAMYYGTPAIAGNADGSTDALLHGALGLLIEPDNVNAITEAIQKMITKKADFIPDHDLLMENFGYDAYKKKLEAIIN
jgi:phosphatidyl-myo-inositol dimannoside synthase